MTKFFVITLIVFLITLGSYSNLNASETCDVSDRKCTENNTSITSQFGERWGSFHTGTDYGLRCGTEIFSAAAGSRLPAFGRVIEVGNLLRISSGGQAAG